jgi:hypothetical protein
VTVHHYLVGKVRDNTSRDRIDLHAWVFISSGLQPLASGELVMVVKRRAAETPDSYPTDFLGICDTVYDRASSAPLRLRRWMLISLDEPIFQRPDFRTVALGLRNSPLLGLETTVPLHTSPVPHYYCLALSDGEAAAARKGGIVRTLVRTGDSLPWFPFPFYVDRDRTPALTAASMDRSIMAGTAFRKLEEMDLNVIHDRTGQITLHVPPERVAEFKEAIRKRWVGAASERSMLIEARMHDGCECVYTWTPGQTAAVRTMSRQCKMEIAANFLLLSFNQASEAVSVVEDGLLGTSRLT